MGFDKAKCERCPLRKYWQAEGKWERVDFLHNGSDVLVLGDAPSKQASVRFTPAWAQAPATARRSFCEASRSPINLGRRLCAAMDL